MSELIGAWIDEEGLEANTTYKGDTTNETGGDYIPEINATLVCQIFQSPKELLAYADALQSSIESKNNE